jgi:hypothetical protein
MIRVDAVIDKLVEAYPVPLLLMTVGEIKAMPLPHLKWKLAFESFAIHRALTFVKGEVVADHRLVAYDHLRELCYVKGIQTWELDMMIPRLRKTQVRGSIFCEDKARILTAK